MELGLESALFNLEEVKKSLQHDYDHTEDGFERDYVADNIQRLEHAIRVIKAEMENQEALL